MEGDKGYETHNLVLTTFLPSQQIKHIAFIRLEAAKVMINDGMEYRFITGLVAATINTLKIYAIYENFMAFELGSWRLHEDITGILGWDKIIVVNTTQRIIGLKYESGHLRNSFMINLDFLNLDTQDTCEVFGDRLGYYLVIKVRNYLLLCFSETLLKKYKGVLVQKRQYWIVEEEVKWNQPTQKSMPIAEIIKIKLTELDICKMDQFSLGDDSIYFVGYRGKEPTVYLIDIFYFFHSQLTQRGMLLPILYRENPNFHSKIVCASSKGITNQNPDILQIDNAKNSLVFKAREKVYQVEAVNKDHEVITTQSTIFPILLWDKKANKYTLIQKLRNFQDSFQFKKTEINNSSYAQKIIYREDGIFVFASKNQLSIIGLNGSKQILHQSLGNIVDLHVGKNMLLIENYEDRFTKLHQICRGPRTDPRPFVTHKKKMHLEELNDLQTIYTVKVGKDLEILAVKQKKQYTFLKEGTGDFQQILEKALDIRTFKKDEEHFLIIKTLHTKLGKSITYRNQQFIVEQFEWEGWQMPKRHCVGEYLIANHQQNWNFYNLLSGKQQKVSLSANGQVKRSLKMEAFIKRLKWTAQKSQKTNEVFELFICYNNQLQVWHIDLTLNECKLIHLTKNLQIGSLVLNNDLITPNAAEKDKYRSITCPQYVMSEHGLRYISTTEVKPKNIKYFYHYEYNDKQLLLIVNGDDQLLIYRKYFNVQSGGFLYKRVRSNLNIAKNFKFTTALPPGPLGEELVRIGNFFIYKGELLEQIPAKSVFRMEGSYWAVLQDNKIRMVHQLGHSVVDGFCIRNIECGIKSQLMGIESSVQFYCVYSRKSFEVYTKDFNSHWKCTLTNETIVCLKMCDNYIGMSYFDYYSDENGVNDYHSVKFRFRIYNCTFKAKSVEREKSLEQPILHIRFITHDKILLVTSSCIFVNVVKNDVMEPFKTHNFSSKRSFLTSFAYIPEAPPYGLTVPGKSGFMLFGGHQGGLSFFVGRWLEDQHKLNEQWHEGFRCGVRDVSFFHFQRPYQQKLKCVMIDNNGNIVVLLLNKDGAEKIADIRLGSEANSLKSNSNEDKVMFCCLKDGSIKILTSVRIDIKVDRLDNEMVSYLDFQDKFCDELPFQGGFNERSSRRLNQKLRSEKFISKGNVIDGDILQEFFALTTTLQQYILTESEMEMSALKSMIPF